MKRISLLILSICFCFVEAEALVWSTYVGGDDDDGGEAVVFDSAENLIMAGTTSGNDFPVTEGAYDRDFNGGQDDLFVAGISSDGGSLRFATYIGGNAYDYMADLEFMWDGRIAITGWTESQNFPVAQGAFDESYNRGTSDGYLLQLSSNGNQLLTSTYFGGAEADNLTALEITPGGEIVVVGASESWNFPVTDEAYDDTYNDGWDVVVARFAGNRLLFSTYLGHVEGDGAADLMLRDDGAIILTGTTGSSEFPTSEGAFDRSHNGIQDGFLAGFTPNLQQLLFCTFWGGRDSDQPMSIVADGESGYLISGQTYSDDIPFTQNAFDRSFNGGIIDGFVARLNSDGSEQVYSTYIGGRNIDIADCLVSDGHGGAIIVGQTYSDNFPATEDGYDRSHNGNIDAFVSRFDGDSGELLYSTFIGGSRIEIATGIVTNGRGRLVLIGSTTSNDFPTTEDAYDRTYVGSEAFILEIDLGLPDFGWVSIPEVVEVNENENVEFAFRGESFDHNEELSIAYFSPNLPEVVNVTDNGDGTGSFLWQTDFDDAGEYLATFTLSDGENEIRSDVIIIVNDAEVVSDFIPHPSSFILSEAFPNPFNSSTTIRFGLPVAGEIALRVCDPSGKEIETLAQGNFGAGYHEVIWNASIMPAGLYIVQLETFAGRQFRKSLLVR